MGSRAQMYKYEFDRVGADKWRLQIWMCETYAPLLKEYLSEIEFDFKDGAKGTCTAILSLTRVQEQALRNLLELFRIRKHVLLKRSENIEPNLCEIHPIYREAGTIMPCPFLRIPRRLFICPLNWQKICPREPAREMEQQ